MRLSPYWTRSLRCHSVQDLLSRLILNCKPDSHSLVESIIDVTREPSLTPSRHQLVPRDIEDPRQGGLRDGPRQSLPRLPQLPRLERDRRRRAALLLGQNNLRRRGHRLQHLRPRHHRLDMAVLRLSSLNPVAQPPTRPPRFTLSRSASLHNPASMDWADAYATNVCLRPSCRPLLRCQLLPVRAAVRAGSR